MLQVNFSGYNDYVTDSLYQWDLNQELIISGLGVKVAPVIVFSNRNMSKGIVVQSKLVNDVIICPIPNALLQFSCDIIAHLCSEENQEYKAYETVKIPVIARVEPADYLYTDNVPILTYEAIMADTNDKIDIVQDNIDNVIASLEGNRTLTFNRYGSFETVDRGLQGGVYESELVAWYTISDSNTEAVTVYKINPQTGEIISTFETGIFSHANSMCIIDDVMYIGGGDGTNVIYYSPITSLVEWKELIFSPIESYTVGEFCAYNENLLIASDDNLSTGRTYYECTINGTVINRYLLSVDIDTKSVAGIYVNGDTLYQLTTPYNNILTFSLKRGKFIGVINVNKYHYDHLFVGEVENITVINNTLYYMSRVYMPEGSVGVFSFGEVSLSHSYSAYDDSGSVLMNGLQTYFVGGGNYNSRGLSSADGVNGYFIAMLFENVNYIVGNMDYDRTIYVVNYPKITFNFNNHVIKRMNIINSDVIVTNVDFQGYNDFAIESSRSHLHISAVVNKAPINITNQSHLHCMSSKLIVTCDDFSIFDYSSESMIPISNFRSKLPISGCILNMGNGGTDVENPGGLMPDLYLIRCTINNALFGFMVNRRDQATYYEVLANISGVIYRAIVDVFISPTRIDVNVISLKVGEELVENPTISFPSTCLGYLN